MTQPSRASSGPVTCTTTRNECPWSRAHLWPSGTFGSRWAASKLNSRNISIGGPLGKTEQFMRLDTQPPARMLQAVPDRERGVPLAVGAIHRLQEEVREVERLEPLRRRGLLRVDQLELVAPAQH